MDVENQIGHREDDRYEGRGWGDLDDKVQEVK